MLNLYSKIKSSIKNNLKKAEYRKLRKENNDEFKYSLPKEAIKKSEKIYQSLTPEEQQKWNECIKKAEEGYFTMMEDLGYEKNDFKFYPPLFFSKDTLTDLYLERGAGQLAFNKKNSFYIKIDRNNLKYPSSYIIRILIHENIHANDINKTNRNSQIRGLGFDYSFCDIKVNGETLNLNYLISKITHNNTKDLTPVEKYFLDLIKNQDKDRIISCFDNKLQNDDMFHRITDFLLRKTKKDKQGLVKILNRLVQESTEPFGSSINEAATDYFALKSVEDNIDDLPSGYYKIVKKLTNFIEALPQNLQKSFERALMDAKTLNPQEGGGYPCLVRWFYNNLGLRVTPLVFVDMNFERDDIQKRLKELKEENPEKNVVK